MVLRWIWHPIKRSFAAYLKAAGISLVLDLRYNPFGGFVQTTNHKQLVWLPANIQAKYLLKATMEF
jgi:hypothetical protein